MATYNGVARGAVAARVSLLAFVVSAIAAMISVLVLPAAFAVDRAVDLVGGQLLDIPPLPEDQVGNLAVNSVVLAADGTVLAELHAEENRVPVDLAEVPSITQQAVIATEDTEFYRHSGVNHQAMVRALLRNLQAGEVEEGGSTITQQLVKNTLLTHARTVDRKIQEAVWSIELERLMSKQDILEAYLNTTYFGRGVYGIGTAARFYFSKHVSQLDLAESAMLAGLIRAPERNNPIFAPDAAASRRNVVLRQMVAQGFITAQEAEEASAQPVELNIQEDSGPREPYFVEWVKRMLFDEEIALQPEALHAVGAGREARQRMVFEGGLVIHTTLDPAFQDIAEETLRTYLDDPLESPMGALVTVDAQSGAVVTMAVGPKEFGTCQDPDEPCLFTNVNPVVYGAGGSGRQTGSAFKPIVAAAALAEGFTPGYTAETTSGQSIDGCEATPGVPYQPANFAGSGGGDMTMYDAMARSNNVYHVKLARDAGVPKVLEMAKRLGIQHIPNEAPYHNEKACSIGLGAADVYPLEFASAFATFANRGERCAPFAISRIEDRTGNTIYSHRGDCERVLERGVADRVNDLLRGPVTSGGTAGFVAGQLGRPVAGKTGTTNDFKDAWFAGHVPQFATVSWVGYEIPKELYNVRANGVTYARVTGGSIPARMWADYMAAALVDTPVERFVTPPPIPTRSVPDVVGLHVDQAEEVVTERGFMPRVTEVLHHETRGTVVAQSPDGGESAWVGSAVVLYVSDGEGEPPRSTVPSVLGRTLEDARRIIEGVGLTVRVVNRPTTNPSRDGIVLEQDPPAGTQLEPGARVTLRVGRLVGGGPPDDDDNGDNGDDDNGDDNGDNGDDDDNGGDNGDNGDDNGDGDEPPGNGTSDP